MPGNDDPPPPSSNRVFSSIPSGGIGSRGEAAGSSHPVLSHQRVRVCRGVKADAWDHFTRSIIKFDRAYFFAICKYCSRDLSAADLLSFEAGMGFDSAVTTEERKAFRLATRDRGFVKGRADEMHRHLKLKCLKAPESVKTYARATLSSSRSAQSIAESIGKATFAALTGASAPSSAQAGRQISG